MLLVGRREREHAGDGTAKEKAGLGGVWAQISATEF
jgi:hypothetical protein